MVRKSATRIGARLLESDKAIQTKIYQGLATEVNKVLIKKVDRVRSNIVPIIQTALLASPAIVSLGGGVLRFDFSLTADPGPQIVDGIISSLRVKVQKAKASSGSIRGGFILYMQPANYSNLLSLPIAMQALEIEARIPWLEWLLTVGDTIIIANFGVEYGAGLGRSGGAHMVKFPSPHAHLGPFKVNSQFSGNVDNNFITKAIAEVEAPLQNAIMEAFK